MIELVTFEQMKEHLRVDHDEDDVKIQNIVMQASSIVWDHIKADDYEFDWVSSSGSPMDVPYAVEAATLLVGGALYENADGAEAGPQPLSKAVRDLLTPRRDPELA